MGFKERANRMKRNLSFTQCVAFIGIALIIVGSFLPYWSINNEEGEREKGFDSFRKDYSINLGFLYLSSAIIGFTLMWYGRRSTIFISGLCSFIILIFAHKDFVERHGSETSYSTELDWFHGTLEFGLGAYFILFGSLILLISVLFLFQRMSVLAEKKAFSLPKHLPTQRQMKSWIKRNDNAFFLTIIILTFFLDDLVLYEPVEPIDFQKMTRTYSIEIWSNESFEMILPIPLYYPDHGVCDITRNLGLSLGTAEFFLTGTEYGDALKVKGEGHVLIFGFEEYEQPDKEPRDYNNSLSWGVMLSMSNITLKYDSYDHSDWYYNSTNGAVNNHPFNTSLLFMWGGKGNSTVYSNISSIHADVEIMSRDWGWSEGKFSDEEGDISDEIMRWGDAGSRSWWTVDITPASSGFHTFPIEYKSIHYD